MERVAVAARLYYTWLNSLDLHAAAKVAIAELRIQRRNTSNIKRFGGIGEYVLILFGGGAKGRQQADIEHAKALLAEYKIRKRLAGGPHISAKDRKR